MEVADKKRAVMIHPSRMRLAEYDRQEWTVNAELGTTIEDVLNPGYWAHMSEQMKTYDHLEVRIDDGSWIAYMLVTACDRNWARVKLLARYDLVDDQSVPAASKAHDVKWSGPHFKWSVIRLADNARVNQGCNTRAEALSWLANHEKTP